MSKWIPLIVLAVLAIGSSVYFSRGSGGQDFAVLENGAQAPATTKRVEAPTAKLRGLNDNSGTTTADRNSGAARVERTSLGPHIQVAAAGGEFQVLLIDPKRRTPVEGMNVFLLDRGNLGPDEWRQAGNSVRDLRKLIKDRGAEQVSDQEGTAYFERVLDGAIWAEGKGWQGYIDWIGPPVSPLELTLSPHNELEVVVLDGDGHTVAQVPLAILSKTPGQWVALLKRTTPATGTAQFPGVSNLAGRSTSEVPLAVGFHFPHEPRVWQEIDPEWLPEDPIELRIPPNGPLTIRVVDGAGQPLEESFMVNIGMPSETAGERVPTILSVRGSQGEATFPFIGINAPVRVQLAGSKELKDLIVDVQGPEPGEKDAVREIAWYERRLRVSGLAKGPGGPLLNRRLTAGWGDGRTQTSIPITTDETGNFTVVMTGNIGAYLHLRAQPEGAKAPSTAVVSLPNPLPEGDWNAGVVQFEGEPLFAEGRVMDLAGAPVAGARVVVESWHTGTPSGGGKGGVDSGASGRPSREGDGKGAGGKGGGAGGKGGGAGGKGGTPGKESDEKSEAEGTAAKESQVGYWAQVGRLIAISDAQGNFRIYGKSFVSRMRLTVQKPDFLDQSIENLQAGMGPLYFNLESGKQTRANATIAPGRR